MRVYVGFTKKGLVVRPSKVSLLFTLARLLRK